MLLFHLQGKRRGKSPVPPPLRSCNPITTSPPCSHLSGDFPDSVVPAWFLAQIYWAYWVTLVTKWHSHDSWGEFATEKVCKGIICPTASLNQKVRGVNISDLNVCSNIASKQRTRRVSKVGNSRVRHQCHTQNKCSVLCSCHHILHTEDQHTWLGVNPSFYCCRRPVPVAWDPLCLQAVFCPPCLLWAVNSPREMSS